MTSKPAEWTLRAEYSPRPHARAEAWVYHIENHGKPWGVLVDEKVLYKTLFTPSHDLHEEWDEVIVPIEGRYWVRVADWSRTLTPGEGALIPAGTDHDSGLASNLVGTHFLVLLFDKRLGVLAGKSAGGLSLPSGTIHWLKGAFRFLKQNATPITFLPLSILPDFISKVLEQPYLPCDSTHADPLVTEVIKLLEQPDTPDLEAISKHVELSPAHLQKRFVAAVGVSPLQYARAWQLDLIAAELKKGTAVALVDLAVEHGFNDMKHFRELFRRRFGCLPAAYRKNPPS